MPVNLHPWNAHPYKTGGERAEWDLIPRDHQWGPGSCLCFKGSHTKFMPKFHHVVSGQVDAQVAEWGQELIWHIMAPNSKMICGCEKLSYPNQQEYSCAWNWTGKIGLISRETKWCKGCYLSWLCYFSERGKNGGKIWIIAIWWVTLQ